MKEHIKIVLAIAVGLILGTMCIFTVYTMINLSIATTNNTKDINALNTFISNQIAASKAHPIE